MNTNNQEKDYLIIQQDFCNFYKVDFEAVKEFNSKVISLTQQDISLGALKALFNALGDLEQNLDYCQNLLTLSKSNEMKQKNQEKSLFDLFLYLLLVEGVFSKIVQIITSLLMEKDHDIYDPQEMEFVSKYDKLERIPLFIKLQFLEKHGFEFITQSVDRELRNCIAHIDIIVKEDGTIVNKRTDKPIHNLRQKTNQLIGVISIAICILDYALKKGSKIKQPTKKFSDAKT